MVRNVKKIFLHCSASPWGNALVFEKWHLARGWSGIGYHFVVLNGRSFEDVEYWPFLDGAVQPGRALDDDPIFEANEVGAHVAGRNLESIGICMVGKKEFTRNQLQATKELILYLVKHFNLRISDVLGHYEDPNTWKTCPNVPVSAFRDYISDNITVDVLQSAIAAQLKVGWEHLRKKNDAVWYTTWKEKL
jgi:hypothetical protein